MNYKFVTNLRLESELSFLKSVLLVLVTNEDIKLFQFQDIVG